MYIGLIVNWRCVISLYWYESALYDGMSALLGNIVSIWITCLRHPHVRIVSIPAQHKTLTNGVVQWPIVYDAGPTLKQHCFTVLCLLRTLFLTKMDVMYEPYTVDLVIFARFYFSRISRRGQIRELKNLVEIIFIFALLKKNENSRIFVKTPKIKQFAKI